MLDKKDLDAIEKMFDRKFLEVENRLDKKIDTKIDAKFEAFETKMNAKIDTKFEAFETKIDTKIDTKFKDFKEQFSLELSDVLHDITNTINYRFNEIEKKFAIQDKKIDLLLEYSNDNLHKHEEYDRNFSRIDSKLLNHDLKLHSLEAHSAII